MLRHEYFVTEGPSNKLPGDANDIRFSARCTFCLGSGAEAVAEFRCDRPELTLPALYGDNGLGDLGSVKQALKNPNAR